MQFSFLPIGARRHPLPTSALRQLCSWAEGVQLYLELAIPVGMPVHAGGGEGAGAIAVARRSGSQWTPAWSCRRSWMASFSSSSAGHTIEGVT